MTIPKYIISKHFYFVLQNFMLRVLFMQYFIMNLSAGDLFMKKNAISVLGHGDSPNLLEVATPMSSSTITI